MIFTTTPSIEGKRITCYHGVVAGEAALGMSLHMRHVKSVNAYV